MSEVKLRLAVRDLYRGDGGRLSSYDEGWNDGVDAAAEILYPPVPPTSVTEEWVRYRRREAYNVAHLQLYSTADAAIRATLAALNIEVTK